MRAAGIVLVVAWACVTRARAAVMLPGTTNDFMEDDRIEIQTNVLTSISTHLPYEYRSLAHHCRPTRETKSRLHNLGQMLMGDRIKPSPYEDIRVGQNVDCAVLCSAHEVAEKDTKKLVGLIKHDYHVNLILDNLPLATVHDDGQYANGVPMGAVEGGVPYVFNHIHFRIKVYELTEAEVKKKYAAEGKRRRLNQDNPEENKVEDPMEVPHYRIISFIGEPLSIKHGDNPRESTCDPKTFMRLKRQPQLATDPKITYTYSVAWERTEDTWITRWDPYLNGEDHDIHWMSIVNSVLVVVLLSTVVAGIIVRMLRRDIAQINLDDDPDMLIEDVGWKMIRKDVFRPPERGWLLSALVGAGAQIFGMTCTVIVFAALGFLSPASRGSLFTGVIVIFALLGVYGGYTSARLLKTWGISSWGNILVTAVLVPGFAFGVFFMVNLLVWSQGSAGAVPFLAMLAVVGLWFGISVPLVFSGAVLGFRRPAISTPVPVSQIPRHIPEPPLHMQPWFTVLLGGLLPFGAVFIEAFFILSAVWLNRYYYVFGFLMLVFVILCVTNIEITLVMTYFQLCAENHLWAWRSFLTGASCGLYMFVYSIYYFAVTARITTLIPIIIYFSYMGLVSALFALITGTVSFAATFAFVRFMYSSIKLD